MKKIDDDDDDDDDNDKDLDDINKKMEEDIKVINDLINFDEIAKGLGFTTLNNNVIELSHDKDRFDQTKELKDINDIRDNIEKAMEYKLENFKIFKIIYNYYKEDKKLSGLIAFELMKLTHSALIGINTVSGKKVEDTIKDDNKDDLLGRISNIVTHFEKDNPLYLLSQLENEKIDILQGFEKDGDKGNLLVRLAKHEEFFRKKVKDKDSESDSDSDSEEEEEEKEEKKEEKEDDSGEKNGLYSTSKEHNLTKEKIRQFL